jgi:hypothetical protein
LGDETVKKAKCEHDNSEDMIEFSKIWMSFTWKVPANVAFNYLLKHAKQVVFASNDEGKYRESTMWNNNTKRCLKEDCLHSELTGPLNSHSHTYVPHSPEEISESGCRPTPHDWEPHQEKSIWLLMTCTRESSSTSTFEKKIEEIHSSRFTFCKKFLQNRKFFKDHFLLMRSFHKVGPSDTTIEKHHITLPGSNHVYYPFSTILSSISLIPWRDMDVKGVIFCL